MRRLFATLLLLLSMVPLLPVATGGADTGGDEAACRLFFSSLASTIAADGGWSLAPLGEGCSAGPTPVSMGYGWARVVVEPIIEHGGGVVLGLVYLERARDGVVAVAREVAARNGSRILVRAPLASTGLLLSIAPVPDDSAFAEVRRFIETGGSGPVTVSLPVISRVEIRYGAPEKWRTALVGGVPLEFAVNPEVGGLADNLTRAVGEALAGALENYTGYLESLDPYQLVDWVRSELYRYAAEQGDGGECSDVLLGVVYEFNETLLASMVSEGLAEAAALSRSSVAELLSSLSLLAAGEAAAALLASASYAAWLNTSLAIGDTVVYAPGWSTSVEAGASRLLLTVNNTVLEETASVVDALRATLLGDPLLSRIEEGLRRAVNKTLARAGVVDASTRILLVESDLPLDNTTARLLEDGDYEGAALSLHRLLLRLLDTTQAAPIAYVAESVDLPGFVERVAAGHTPLAIAGYANTSTVDIMLPAPRLIDARGPRVPDAGLPASILIPLAPSPSVDYRFDFNYTVEEQPLPATGGANATVVPVEARAYYEDYEPVNGTCRPVGRVARVVSGLLVLEYGTLVEASLSSYNVTVARIAVGAGSVLVRPYVSSTTVIVASALNETALDSLPGRRVIAVAGPAPRSGSGLLDKIAGAFWAAGLTNTSEEYTVLAQRLAWEYTSLRGLLVPGYLPIPVSVATSTGEGHTGLVVPGEYLGVALLANPSYNASYYIGEHTWDTASWILDETRVLATIAFGRLRVECTGCRGTVTEPLAPGGSTRIAGTSTATVYYLAASPAPLWSMGVEFYSIPSFSEAMPPSLARTEGLLRLALGYQLSTTLGRLLGPRASWSTPTLLPNAYADGGLVGQPLLGLYYGDTGTRFIAGDGPLTLTIERRLVVIMVALVWRMPVPVPVYVEDSKLASITLETAPRVRPIPLAASVESDSYEFHALLAAGSKPLLYHGVYVPFERGEPIGYGVGVPGGRVGLVDDTGFTITPVVAARSGEAIVLEPYMPSGLPLPGGGNTTIAVVNPIVRVLEYSQFADGREAVLVSLSLPTAGGRAVYEKLLEELEDATGNATCRAGPRGWGDLGVLEATVYGWLRGQGVRVEDEARRLLLGLEEWLNGLAGRVDDLLYAAGTSPPLGTVILWSVLGQEPEEVEVDLGLVGVAVRLLPGTLTAYPRYVSGMVEERRGWLSGLVACTLASLGEVRRGLARLLGDLPADGLVALVANRTGEAPLLLWRADTPVLAWMPGGGLVELEDAAATIEPLPLVTSLSASARAAAASLGANGGTVVLYAGGVVSAAELFNTTVPEGAGAITAIASEYSVVLVDFGYVVPGRARLVLR